MQKQRWTRNTRPRLLALAGALLATLGFYGLIQANPPATANSTQAPASATPSPERGGLTVTLPSRSGQALPPLTGSSSETAPPPVSAPRTARPVTRTRGS